ncbi:YoaK family protein [Lichenicoccus sp.]|uniref:YoaK family protein n=1 Tax=Lichenicoccus sp. TaxID=2781899 RepID=UPI003D0EDF74
MTHPGLVALRHPASRASWLALIAGLCDGLGWLQTGLFAAQMTGNTALLGVALAQGHWRGAAQKATAILCFLAGSLAARLLLRSEKEPGRGRVLVVLVASLVILVAAFLPKPVNVLVLGAALGGQNAVFTRFGGQSINTSFVSGDLQKLAQALARRITRGAALDDGDRIVLVTVPSLWSTYVAGAAVGVFCARGLALPLLVPAAMLPLVLLLPKDRSQAG